jgi:hypothetical protein
MASSILYLRPQEKKIFEKLSGELKEGWKVEEETVDHEERPEELKMRQLMFRVSDPEVKKTLESSTIESAQDLEKIFNSLQNFPKVQMMEIFFTLGSKALSAFLQGLLDQVKSDDDLQGIAELSHVRHALLKSNAQFSLSST